MPSPVAVSRLLWLLVTLSLSLEVFTTDLVQYAFNDTILCLGDSLTHGLYVTSDDEPGESSNAHPYSLQLEKSLKSSSVVIEAGTNGATLSEMLTSLPSLLAQYNPIVVVILGGTNDLIQAGGENGIATPDRMMASIAQLHKIALNYVRKDKKKVMTVAITIPPVDGHGDTQEATRSKVNAGIVKLPKHHHRTFVCDLAAQTQFAFANKYSPFWSADGLHLSATGYDVLGKLVFNTLLESQINDRATSASS